MEVELITKSDLENFKADIISEIRQLLGTKTSLFENRKWFKSRDVQKILQISPGTLQTLRNRKMIPFTRLGGVIYYSQEDLKKALEKKDDWDFEFLKGK